MFMTNLIFPIYKYTYSVLVDDRRNIISVDLPSSGIAMFLMNCTLSKTIGKLSMDDCCSLAKAFHVNVYGIINNNVILIIRN